MTTTRSPRRGGPGRRHPRAVRGVRNSRSLAMNTSKTARSTPDDGDLGRHAMTSPTTMPRDASLTSRCPRGRARLTKMPSSSASRMASPSGDEREVRSGVLEDHGLVDHGELEVGGRVVHREPPALGHDDDEQRREGEEPLRCDDRPGVGQGGADDGRESSRSAR